MNLNPFGDAGRQAGRKTPEKTEKRDKGRTYPAWGRHPAVLGGKCTSGWIDDYYWSSPSLIAQTAIIQWKEKNLAYDIYFTSMSTIGGFFSGNIGRRSFRIVLLVVKDVCKDF